jgi:hypothetical protein
MVQQVERWLKNKRNAQPNLSVINVDATRKEIDSLKQRVDRYTHAYSKGVFTVEELQTNILPLKEKITLFENQITKAETEKERSGGLQLPKKTEINAFSRKAQKSLLDLNFTAKKAIVSTILEKVVGTKEELHVYGHIPITQNVEYFPSHRYRRPSKRWQINAV